jgi:hypothetical protein
MVFDAVAAAGAVAVDAVVDAANAPVDKKPAMATEARRVAIFMAVPFSGSEHAGTVPPRFFPGFSRVLNFVSGWCLAMKAKTRHILPPVQTTQSYPAFTLHASRLRTVP